MNLNKCSYLFVLGALWECDEYSLCSAHFSIFLDVFNFLDAPIEVQQATMVAGATI